METSTGALPVGEIEAGVAVAVESGRTEVFMIRGGGRREIDELVLIEVNTHLERDGPGADRSHGHWMRGSNLGTPLLAAHPLDADDSGPSSGSGGILSIDNLQVISVGSLVSRCARGHVNPRAERTHGIQSVG